MLVCESVCVKIMLVSASMCVKIVLMSESVFQDYVDDYIGE